MDAAGDCSATRVKLSGVKRLLAVAAALLHGLAAVLERWPQACDGDPVVQENPVDAAGQAGGE